MLEFSITTFTSTFLHLQAMFEVITSEASYYRSLQVLIDHFYSAPEFDCSRSAPTSMEAPSGGAENDHDNTPSQGNEGRASNASIASGGYSRAGSISVSTEATAAPVVKSVLSPTEKHHLFSNVLLICMASERLVMCFHQRHIYVTCAICPFMMIICSIPVEPIKYVNKYHF